MAILRGGPADGLTLDTDGRDVEWVASRTNCFGRRVPLTTLDGHAVTLPDAQGPETENLLNHAGEKWECYRRSGADVPELGERDWRADLPYRSDGVPIYRHVCRRRPGAGS